MNTQLIDLNAGDMKAILRPIAQQTHSFFMTMTEDQRAEFIAMVNDSGSKYGKPFSLSYKREA